MMPVGSVGRARELLSGGRAHLAFAFSSCARLRQQNPPQPPPLSSRGSAHQVREGCPRLLQVDSDQEVSSTGQSRPSKRKEGHLELTLALILAGQTPPLTTPLRSSTPSPSLDPKRTLLRSPRSMETCTTAWPRTRPRCVGYLPLLSPSSSLIPASLPQYSSPPSSRIMYVSPFQTPRLLVLIRFPCPGSPPPSQPITTNSNPLTSTIIVFGPPMTMLQPLIQHFEQFGQITAAAPDQNGGNWVTITYRSATDFSFRSFASSAPL